MKVLPEGPLHLYILDHSSGPSVLQCLHRGIQQYASCHNAHRTGEYDV